MIIILHSNLLSTKADSILKLKSRRNKLFLWKIFSTETLLVTNFNTIHKSPQQLENNEKLCVQSLPWNIVWTQPKGTKKNNWAGRMISGIKFTCIQIQFGKVWAWCKPKENLLPCLQDFYLRPELLKLLWSISKQMHGFNCLEAVKWSMTKTMNLP